MPLDSFIEKQNSVYALMRASAGEVERHGIKFEKNLFERRGAFTVALKHEPRVATALASLSHQIADLVPSVAYAADELHTTLCLYGKSINFVYDADDAAQQKLLHALEHAAKMVCQKNREVVFDFVEYIMTPEAVIAAGVPDQSFVDVLEAMVTEAACQGVVVEPAWGAHVTVARFKDTADRPTVKALVETVKNAIPPGRCVARSITVGYSLWRPSPERPHIAPERLQGQLAAHWECSLRSDDEEHHRQD